MQAQAEASGTDLAASSLNLFDMELLSKMIETILGNSAGTSTAGASNSVSLYT